MHLGEMARCDPLTTSSPRFTAYVSATPASFFFIHLPSRVRRPFLSTENDGDSRMADFQGLFDSLLSLEPLARDGRGGNACDSSFLRLWRSSERRVHLAIPRLD